jgi:hypothetical protein
MKITPPPSRGKDTGGQKKHGQVAAHLKPDRRCERDRKPAIHLRRVHSGPPGEDRLVRRRNPGLGLAQAGRVAQGRPPLRWPYSGWRCALPPPGTACRREGYLRHRRRAHGNGFSRLCRPYPEQVGPGDRTARGPRGLCHGEDRDHGMRLFIPRKDPQSLEPAPYAGRVVQRLRCGGRGRLCPCRPGYANQRLRHPARRVLRGRGLQADPGPPSHRRGPDFQPHPGSTGHLHPSCRRCRVVRDRPVR